MGLFACLVQKSDTQKHLYQNVSCYTAANLRRLCLHSVTPHPEAVRLTMESFCQQ